MWYDGFDFYDRQPGLSPTGLPTDATDDFLSASLSSVEKTVLEKNLSSIGITSVHPANWTIPQFILPEEYKQLLAYSNGGGIINGNREFGFFSLEEIRQYYLHYHFPQYTPHFLPIAFDGGGIFYAYDYRKQVEGTAGVAPNNSSSRPILALAAGNLSDEDSALLGHSLKEVLTRSTGIGEYLDTQYAARRGSSKN
jgi:SMI1 / KNR4 family (SUKH-1)